MSPLDLALISVLGAVAAFPQNVAGFGFALVLAPLLVLFIDPAETVILVNILATLSATVVVWRLRRAILWRTVGVLILASLAGMPLGLLALLVLDPAVIQALIAVAVLGGLLTLARGLTLGGGAAIAAVMGVAGGFLRTSTSAAGPPVILYLQARQLPPDPFRATGSFFLMTTGAVAIALYAVADRLDGGIGLAVGAAIPGVAIGSAAGAALAGRVNERWFRRLVTVLLVATALTALVTAFLG